MELRDRITDVDKGVLYRLIERKELPDVLVLAYLRIKKLVDKLDARLKPSDMAFVVLSAGYDPETKLFNGEVEPAKAKEVKRKIAPAVKKPQSPDDTVAGNVFTNGTKVEVFYKGQVIKGKVVDSDIDGKNTTYYVKIANVDDPLVLAENEVSIAVKG